MWHISIQKTLLAVICLALASAQTTAASRSLSLIQPDQTELNVTIFPSDGSRLVIWLPSVFGQPEAEQGLLSRLAGAGIEVWLAHLLNDRFLPRVNSSLEQIPPADVMALAQAAHTRTGKRIFLAGLGRGAVPIMRGAAAWETTNDGHLQGIVLFWPNLYVRTPEPGRAGVYLPVVRRVKSPILLYQPVLSTRYWYRDQLQAALSNGGAPVLVETPARVRDGFFARAEPLPAEIDLVARFPSEFQALLEQLDRLTRVSQHLPAAVRGER